MLGVGHSIYGYGSGWIVVVFIALALARYFTSRSRRGRRPGSPGPMGQWGQGFGPTSAPPGVGQPPTVPTGQRGIPAGWMPDPSGKFDQRYWSGTAWTEHVLKGGVPSVDPPPGSQRRAEGAAAAQSSAVEPSTPAAETLPSEGLTDQGDAQSKENGG